VSYLPEDYEPVEDRIRAFYKDHPQGRITTDIISLDGDSVTFRASVYRELDPDPSPAATGHAHGLLTKPKAVEFIETVSIGRALANLNYAKQGARASQEEMQAFQDVKQPSYPPRNPARKQASQPATEKQVKFARLLIDTVEEGSEVAAQILGSEPIELADKATVSALIEDLKARKEAAAEKVTRSKGQQDDDWHLQPEPEEVPF
jgi:predicted fused transcriptional regulator/phosphomethylpyrimidine kinase